MLLSYPCPALPLRVCAVSQWVNHTLGRYWSFVLSYNAIFCSWLDNPLYIVLFAGYLQQMFDIPDAAMFVIKYIALLATVGLNIVGIEAVSWLSVVFTVIVFIPFLTEPFMVTYHPAVSAVQRRIQRPYCLSQLW